MGDQNDRVVEVGKKKAELGKALMSREEVMENTGEERAKVQREINGRSKAQREAELNPEQRQALDALKAAKDSEERVKLYAKFADDFGLDALLSLIPELGDAGSSLISGVYLLFEAKRAGLDSKDYLKIVGLQAADFAVGAIPVLGDIADYFFKANKWSAKSFTQHTEELVRKAREAGVPEDQITKLTQSAEKLPQLLGKAVGLAGKVKKVAG